MPVDDKLLEILVCPACRGEIREIEDALHCTDCERIYPIRDGIPVLIVSEAYKTPAKDYDPKFTPAQKRRARSSGHYDNPMRANTRFYALDIDGNFVASAD